MTVDTTTIITKIAKQKFHGVELKQKGQSRMWYFSGHYYLVLVEFQPSSWDKGTYLNVGLDFNWYPRGYFAFEFGHRLSDFHQLTTESQFEAVVDRLCDLAINKVAEYKDIFVDRPTAADKLLKLHSDDSNHWEIFHIGMTYGLGGNIRKSIDYLRKVSGDKYQLDWEKERASVARDYLFALETGDFLTKMDATIRRTKELKRVS